MPRPRLARAYLHSDLSPDDRAAAEGAMIMLLDDPVAAGAARARRGVRLLAEGAARHRRCAGRRPSADCGTDFVALAADARSRSHRSRCHQPSRSAGGNRRPRAVAADARRRHCRSRSVRKPVSRCWKIPTPTSRTFPSTAWSSASAILPPSAKTLLARDDLPMPTRQALLSKLSQTLGRFRHREALARLGARRIGGAGSLRAGDCRARRRDAL